MRAVKIIYDPTKDKEFHAYIFKHFRLNGPIIEAENLDNYDPYNEKEEVEA